MMAVAVMCRGTYLAGGYLFVCGQPVWTEGLDKCIHNLGLTNERERGLSWILDQSEIVDALGPSPRSSQPLFRVPYPLL